jgi:thioredoxin reductase
VLEAKGIRMVETPIGGLEHANGQLQSLIFQDGTRSPLAALYTRAPFEQHCPLPASLGCELTEEGYLKVDPFQRTTISGVYACGDNSSKMRTVASAVSAGTAAGMALNKEMVLEGI